MRSCLLFISFSLASILVLGQYRLDSLQKLYAGAKDDTSRIMSLTLIAFYYAFTKPDSAILYVHKIVEISKKNNYPFGNVSGQRALFFAYNTKAEYTEALSTALNELKIAEQVPKRRAESMGDAYHNLGLVTREMGEDSLSLSFSRQSIHFGLEAGLVIKDNWFAAAYMNIGVVYLKLKQLDSALFYAQKSYDLSESGWGDGRNSLHAAVLGDAHRALGHLDSAKKCYQLAIKKAYLEDNLYVLARGHNNLAALFSQVRNYDSSIYHAMAGLQISQEHKYPNYALDASRILADQYDLQRKPDSALKYLKLMVKANDTVFNRARLQQFQQLGFKEEQRQRDLKAAEEKYQNRIRDYSLLGGLLVLFLVSLILWRNNRQKQKANKSIRIAYDELKSAQGQLIQAEKMASLGEMTAGIAHEIQNPLNFVNNFSEINRELIEDLKKEILSGNHDEVVAIAGNISVNEEKINHHGKRADAIVRSMLQHSRAGTGQVESTNINALIEEWLRLSYVGQKARDKDFVATLKTDFENSIGEVCIMPQDIGRVLLNLFNNAFYAVSEKKVSSNAVPVSVSVSSQSSYEPTVSVSTRMIADKVQVSVKDNGNGIPKKILDKIFQPFFTTKPTGQGTGLGLSLSYDIVKAHRGEINVDTKEGEWTEFSITLPRV
jgi:signal transduction histidine kinase